MAKSKKTQKSSSSNPAPDKVIEIDEGVFGTRLIERENLPPAQLVNLLKTLQKFELLLEEDDDDDDDDDEVGYLLDSDIDDEELEKKLSSILETENITVNLFNLKKYLVYLKNHIKDPCYLEATEEFDWEEKYISGIGSQKQYQKLKKTNPCHLDRFKLVGFSDEFTVDKGIKVNVERTSDRRQFIIPLALLDVIDEDDESGNFELVDYYGYWFYSY